MYRGVATAHLVHLPEQGRRDATCRAGAAIMREEERTVVTADGRHPASKTLLPTWPVGCCTFPLCAHASTLSRDFFTLPICHPHARARSLSLPLSTAHPSDTLNPHRGPGRPIETTSVRNCISQQSDSITSQLSVCSRAIPDPGSHAAAAWALKTGPCPGVQQAQGGGWPREGVSCFTFISRLSPPRRTFPLQTPHTLPGTWASLSL